MSEVRTIPWETISDWFTKNEQQIRDVMKFEGLRGAVNEILRIAPDQPELDAQRLRADTAEADLEQAGATYLNKNAECLQLRKDLAVAEQRIAQTVAKLELAASMLDDDERGNRFAQVLQLAIAALNQESEGESQEDRLDDEALQRRHDDERREYFSDGE